jgi:hypothetical protein
MTINKIKRRFYFGSAGDIQPLPPQTKDPGTDPSAVRYGPLSRALNGTPTVQTYGLKRQWNLSWYRMLHSDPNLAVLQRLDAAYHGYISRRLYLLDTRAVNYLTPDLASVGGEEGTTGFATSVGGVMSRVNNTQFHADLANTAEGTFSWVPPTGASQVLNSGSTVMPVVAGTDYLFSTYMSGTGSVKLAFTFYDKDRTLISTMVGSPITLTGTPTRYSLAFPFGSVPAGSALFLVGLSTNTTTTMVNTAGWQLQYDDAVLAPWAMGRGAAEVIVDSFTVKYPDPYSQIVSATLLEV